MAYKPFKPNKGSYYSGNTQNNSKYEIKRLKLFGFRSGAAWKMIPALFYYALAFLIIVSSIMGEIREFEFTWLDVILCILKYIFIFVVAFSPAIFLSDFEYNKKLPIFKAGSFVAKAMGFVLVNVLCIFLIWTYEYCMSDTYKDSADAYYEEMESKNLEAIKEYESMTEAESEETTEAK